jgi:hypothetical protein
MGKRRKHIMKFDKVKGKVLHGRGSPKRVGREWPKHYPDIKGEVIDTNRYGKDWTQKIVKGDTTTYTPEIRTANVECDFPKWGLFTGMTKYGAALVMSAQTAYVTETNMKGMGYHKNVVEVYIIGWSGNLYDEELEVWDIIEIPWERHCEIRNFEKKVRTEYWNSSEF